LIFEVKARRSLCGPGGIAPAKASVAVSAFGSYDTSARCAPSSSAASLISVLTAFSTMRSTASRTSMSTVSRPGVVSACRSGASSIA